MRSDALIRYEGMRALRECLGLVEAEKFIVLIHREPFGKNKPWMNFLSWLNNKPNLNTTIKRLFNLGN
jgi:hypothetical protein